jgi:hypothetical protein
VWKLFALLATTPLIAVPRLTGTLDRGLAFEQTTGKDRFIWHGPGFSVELGRGEVRMAAGGDVVAMRLAGARKHTIPRAAEPPSAQINYLVGPSSQWRRGIKAYSKVTYPGVYKGIDLVFYGRDGRLEHDFVVHPGGDPNSIQLRWAGATHLALNARGDLSVYTGTGDIRWSAPVVYQSVNGVHTQVDGEFRLLGGDRVGFRVGAYDPNEELVIDPALIFSTYLGGSRNDASRGVAVDASGNVYVTGQTNSLDFPVTAGSFQTAFGGGTTAVVAGDVFVAKYNSSGKLVYATYIGGRRDDIGMAIAVDSSGSAYVTGYTNSGDFPTTPSAIQTAFGGYLGASFIITQGDAFLTKLSPDGTSLVYSTYLGGNNDDAAFGIALDRAGNAYIAGTTQSRNFPVTNGAYQTGYAGSGAQSEFNAFGYAILAGDAFLAKINVSGSALVYCTLLGGP